MSIDRPTGSASMRNQSNELRLRSSSMSSLPLIHPSASNSNSTSSKIKIKIDSSGSGKRIRTRRSRTSTILILMGILSLLSLIQMGRIHYRATSTTPSASHHNSMFEFDTLPHAHRDSIITAASGNNNGHANANANANVNSTETVPHHPRIATLSHHHDYFIIQPQPSNNNQHDNYHPIHNFFQYMFSFISPSMPSSATTNRRIIIDPMLQNNDNDNDESIIVDTTSLNNNENYLEDNQYHQQQQQQEEECVPMVEWQTTSYPNCNLVHEIDLIRSSGSGSRTFSSKHPSRRHIAPFPPTLIRLIRRLAKADHGVTTRTDHRNKNHNLNAKGIMKEDHVAFLGQGWFRSAWKVDSLRTYDEDQNYDDDAWKEEATFDESVVLKTLRCVCC